MERRYTIQIYTSFKSQIPKDITFVQHDTENNLITLEWYDDIDIPMTNIVEATATVQRIDGKTYTYGMNDENERPIFTIEGNVTTFRLPPSAVYVPGKSVCSVSVYDSDYGRITTPVIPYTVTAELVSDTPIDETNQYPVLTGLINETNELKAIYEKALEGSTDMEVIQARGSYEYLKDRFNADEDSARKKNPWKSAEEYPDIKTAIESTPAYGVLVLEPNKEYMTSASIVVPPYITILCNNASIKADPAGTFTSILEGGSGNDTTFDVLLDLYKAEHARFIGNLKVHGNDVANLVGMAASVLSNGANNPAYLSIFDSIIFVRCRKGIYNQASTVSTAGTFTGSRFLKVEFANCTDDIHIKGSCDDLVFGTVRSFGKIIIDNGSGVKFELLYKYGPGSAVDGITLGANVTLLCDHLFIEGPFNYPIVLSGANATVTVFDLLVSSNFTSKDGEALYCGVSTGKIEIHCNGMNTQSAGLTKIILMYAGAATDSRSVIVHQPYTLSAKVPVARTGNSVRPIDVILVYAIDGFFRAEIGGAQVEYSNALIMKGSTRPTANVYRGDCFFDTTLGKPIWRNAGNTDWIDATGTVV